MDPEALLLRSSDSQNDRTRAERIAGRVSQSPGASCVEELPYKQIAQITDLPMGTVMSRLARERKWLQLALTNNKYMEVLS